jgi:hypothetical protein
MMMAAKTENTRINVGIINIFALRRDSSACQEHSRMH